MVVSIDSFLHLFGSRFEYFQLTALILFLTTLNILFKNKVSRIVISFLSALYLILQITSLYFVKKFIGYSFFVHLNTRDITSMVGIYVFPIIIITAFLILAYFLFYKSNKLYFKVNKSFRIASSKSFKILAPVIILSSCFYLMSSKGGAFYRNYELFSMLKISSSNFEDNLAKLGVKDYVSPDKLIVEPGKNVIVISLESFESGFLHEQNAELTPNLQKLKTDWNFYSMSENTGAGWTSGSLYAFMTGFPAFFGSESNSIFQGSYHSDINSIVKVFNKANYETTFITADAQFSGTEDMLNAFNIDFVLDKTQLEEKVKDKDLFDLSKNMVNEKVKNDQPFALFISTLDTHFPDGIYDERMEQFVPKRKSNYNFMISAVDYMVGDFISFLENENLLENTVIYIFPDHLKMGDAAFLKGTGKRELYLLTNAKQQTTGLSDSSKLNQIDLPKVILNGASVKNNAVFFTDYIKGDKNEFIEENLNLLTATNISGFKRLESQDFEIPEQSVHYKSYCNDTSRFIAHAGGMIDNNSYTNSIEALDLNYSNGFRLFELDIIETKDGYYVAAHDWESWSRYTKYSGELPASLKDFKNNLLFGQFTPIAMEEINQWFKSHPDCILITDKVNDPKKFSSQFIDNNRLIMELFSEEAVMEAKEIDGLIAMPTQGLIESFGDNKLNWLIEHDIKYIAISRRFIGANKSFLEELINQGIKAYAFHLNFDAGIDENYAVKYEMDYIYGIYADKWNFGDYKTVD